MSTVSPADGQAFVVIAQFQVKPGSLDAFLDAARDDAMHSLSDEPGCRQFDIIRPADMDDTVIFYEVYDRREDFDAHLETPHLARFREAFPALILEERPVLFSVRHYP